MNLLFTAAHVGGLFFPLAGQMGLPVRATVTPKTTELMVWAGANLGSYGMASDAIERLAGLEISDRRIRLQIEKAGSARIAERDAAIQELKQMTLAQRRTGNPLVAAPELAVVMMDGGRYQRRDHFGETEPSDTTHWRESKVGCLLTMQSEVHEADPVPLIPDCFAHASVVRELAKAPVKQESNEDEALARLTEQASVAPSEESPPNGRKQPRLLTRDVVASGKNSQAFGFHLESRAWRLKFPSAQRQAFVADGSKTNWRIQREHFPRAVPIADLIHALSYVWSAAMAVGTKMTYQTWAQLIWQGDVAEVIAQLERHQCELGVATQDATDNDPRVCVGRCLTYLCNNADHMNYPEYRKQGLPLTSSHIESTIKPINRRIKGTEKFWLEHTSECVLQLRADYLSNSQRMDAFWKRWQAQQNGSNSYNNAC
jgi:hypothetical protein